MDALQHLVLLDSGSLKSLHKITDPLMLGMMENSIALEDALNRDDYKSFVTAGKDVANAGKRFSSKYVAKEMTNGKWQMPGGELVPLAFSGAAILWGAYQTGKRFRKLQLKGKSVVAACFVVGAIPGARVAKLTLAPNRGVMASIPAMLLGAVVGFLVVGVAGVVGYIVGENDRLKEENDTLKEENDTLKKENDTLKKENKDLKTRVSRLEEENDTLKEENDTLKKENDTLKIRVSSLEKENKDLQTRVSRLEALVEQILVNQQQNGNAQ